MAYAGHKVTLYLGGTPTAFTGAATTNLDGNRFQVSDSVKRVLSPGHAVSVLNNGSPLAVSAYTVNYFFGIITLKSAPAGTITVSAHYVPLLEVAEATSINITHGPDDIELRFHGTPEIRNISGQRRCTISHSGTRLLAYSLDEAEVGATWSAIIADDTPKLAQVRLAGGQVLRAWGWYPNATVNSSPGEAASQDLEFHSSARIAMGRTEEVGYSIGEE